MSESPLNPVSIEVEWWWGRIARMPMWLAIPLCVLVAWGTAAAGQLWVGVVVGAAALAVYAAQNRYLIAEAHLGDNLRLRYLGGREVVIDPRNVELTRRSAWRVLWGGWALVTVGKRTCIGVFYPTIEWVDLERLDQRLGPDGLR